MSGSTKISTAALFLVTALLLVGCQTPRQRQQEENRRLHWEDSFSHRLSSLEERIFDLESNLTLLRREQNSIDQRLAGILSSSTAIGGAQRAEIESLRRELEEARGANEKKMAIILDEISRENERIMESIRAARRTAGAQTGYEHTVRSGETISTIAREYHSTVAAIVEANQLANPNSIRVGQTLFIPE